MLNKFKVGDLIKGIHPSKYTYTNDRMALARVKRVNHAYNTMVIEVLQHSNNGCITHFTVENNTEFFELVPPSEHRIEILVEGNKVIAKNLISGKVGIAKCSPEDTFDFLTGATLALERLMEKESLYTGKVVCVEEHKPGKCTTKGRIYEIVNGEFVFDDGTKSIGTKIKSVDDLNERAISKFIEIVE